MHITENPIAPYSVVCFFYIKEKRNQMVSPNEGIPDLGFQVNNVIKSGSALTESTLQRRNKFFFLQNIHQTSIYPMRSKVLQKQLVRAMGR
ncbi:hypothetical protein TNCV_3388391 [Trichonephila clavipes]|nr:hypothetical protein TNCV_3388391 [Trichonephila clavipes]